MLPTFEANKNIIKDKLIAIGDSLVESNRLILEALKDCNADTFNQARNQIKNISSKTDAIDNEIIKVLALYTPEARDLRQVIAYFKIANELSRACSNTRSFIRGFTDACNDLDVATINEYALPMQTSTLKAIEITIKMMHIEDSDELQEMYDEVLIEESKADDLYEMVERSLFKQAEAASNFEKFHKMLKALRKSEKIAARAISIANLLVYIKMGGNFQR